MIRGIENSDIPTSSIMSKGSCIKIGPWEGREYIYLTSRILICQILI